MNFNIRIIIISIICIISFYFFYLGYNEKDIDYDNTYSRAVATIKNKIVESGDVVDKNSDNQFLYVHKKKFRIKVLYTYQVDGENFDGHFYNDGKSDDFIDPEEYMPIAKTYDYIKRITIFYCRDNPRKSYASLSQIRNNKTKLYYVVAVGLLFIIPFILFV